MHHQQICESVILRMQDRVIEVIFFCKQVLVFDVCELHFLYMYIVLLKSLFIQFVSGGSRNAADFILLAKF